MILGPFLEGAQEAGAEAETFYTQGAEIRACLGCLSCWIKNPGECVQKDDMQALYPKIRESDVWVFATPLYWWGMNGPMKNLFDRMMPLGGAKWERIKGRVVPVGPKPPVPGKVVLVSTAGMWGMESFDALVAHMEENAAIVVRDLAGCLLRPQSNVLRPMLDGGAPLGDIFDAAKEAGRQLVTEGSISKETLATVSRDLMPEDAYVQAVNEAMAGMLAAAQGGGA
jgi:putative NADPH-quinone reductase